MIAVWLAIACDGIVDAPDVPPPVGAVSFAPSPLRRLSRDEYVASIGDLFGVDGSSLNLPADDIVGAFTSNVVTPISALGTDQYAAAATIVGDYVQRNPTRYVDCDPDSAECVDDWIEDLGTRTWRRPLDSSDVAALRSVFDVGETPERGLALVVEALLQSPDFLYLVESGQIVEDRVELDGFAVAARLSYFLWGSTPDRTLLDAAARGELDTPEGVEAQARRLLTSSRALRQIQRFYLQWLDVDELDRVGKDADRYPIWDEALTDAMRRDVEQFVAHVYTEGAGTLQAMLSAPYAFPSGPLWTVYGLTPTEGVGPVGLPADQRAGLLTMPAVQATHAHLASTSVVHRGLFLYERLLCGALGAPPDEVDLRPLTVEPGDPLTKREQFAQHLSDPTCAVCHRIIDPLGFVFEHYGPIGEYRTFAPEEGRPVDAGGDLTLALDIDGSYADGVSLARAMGQSADVRRCVARQWYRFALGREDVAADATAIDQLDHRFAAAHGDLRVLLLALVTSDAFRMRQLEETP